MFAANVTMPTEMRAFLAEHAAFFEPLALEDIWYVQTFVAFIDAEGTGSELGLPRLASFAAGLRERAANLRMSETAETADLRAGGQSPNAAFGAYASRIDRYLEGLEFAPPPVFTLAITGATSLVESDAAAATLASLQSHALVSIRQEMAIRPAWQHDLIMTGLEGLQLAFSRPLDAIVVTAVLRDLLHDGAPDLFRVLVRHYAGLSDPLGLDPEEALECARTRMTLAALGMMPPVPETAETLVLMASEQTRVALRHLALAFNCWLEEEEGRWTAPERFQIRLPMLASVSGDLVDLGLLRHKGKRLRLTRTGADACQVVGAQDLRAN